MRVTKKPEERRQELVDIADRLFTERDFDDVKISDIVAEANVAQGTYYYYFKKKEDIVYAVIEKKIMDMAAHLKETIVTLPFSNKKKFEIVMQGLFQPPGQDEPIFVMMSHLNETMHMAIDKIRKEQIAPIIAGIVQDGVDHGEFRKIEHVGIIVDLIFDGISGIIHALSWDKKEEKSYMEKLFGVIELLEIILDVDLSIQLI